MYIFYKVINIYAHAHTRTRRKIEGPDNATSQLLPKSRNKSSSGTGKEGKTKEVAEQESVKMVCVCDKAVCERCCVCMTKLCVCVCDQVACDKMCVKDGVCVCERCCGTKWCVKDGL